ncbi:AEC family transporter [Shewanella eurypsychrophilus]|uniref:AEC family transporter n=1 Tax=Shewanella eurypsychrophilus TaxID=2593656 RepID=A0ABX6VAM8_9GAMM|nr:MULTISPECIES: AEC family transporter [Shewanella]QFU23850.1 AEC family transporter [Shewanella sp. YLB-09]QPG59072.1 AEC family transporter [Shewanella eurypsychrophilus]
MSAILTPLFAVLGIMLLGSFTQKVRILSSDTEQVLNQYVYYIAFPAIMLIVLAETPIEGIMQWGFIAGYSLAMVFTYLLVVLVSFCTNKGRTDIAALRALNTTFGNCAFIGMPLLTILFPDNPNALTAAAIATLLSVIVFAFVLVTIELYHGKKQASPLMIVSQSLIQNPIVIGSCIGVALSALNIEVNESISIMLRQIGMTSSPCALFAIGMVLVKASGTQDEQPLGVNKAKKQDSNTPSRLNHITELSWINLCKLIIQPLFAYLFLSAFGVGEENLIIGVILAALPTAASVFLLAQRYKIKSAISAHAIMLGTILSILTLPAIDYLLRL